jgi:hypothetical protein
MAADDVTRRMAVLAVFCSKLSAIDLAFSVESWAANGSANAGTGRIITRSERLR